jgi:hypothetical protein
MAMISYQPSTGSWLVISKEPASGLDDLQDVARLLRKERLLRSPLSIRN